MFRIQILLAATILFSASGLAEDKSAGKAVAPHASSRSQGRAVNLARKEWTFDNCRKWNDDTNRSESFDFTVSATEHPSTWSSYPRFAGEMQASSEEKLTFEIHLSELEKGFTKFEENWVGLSSGYKGEAHHSKSASFHRNAKTNEKVFSIVTEEPYRQSQPSVNRFRVLTISNAGEMVEAEMTYNQGELYAINVIKTCGNGFGIPNDGKPIVLDSREVRLPEAIGKFPTQMHGTQTIRRRLRSQQMKVVAFNLHQRFQDGRGAEVAIKK